MKIQDKVVLITGASEGIGKALAELLAGKGAKVVLAARSDDKIRALVEKLPGAMGIHADMMKDKDIDSMIKAALQKHGRIDILINNAGQGLFGTVESTDIEQYKAMMNLNVYAPLLAMQKVIPAMRKAGGGLILNISSMVSKNAYPMLGAYASTKYALNALSLTARNELAGDKITVCVFHPKMTATKFGENAVGPHPDFSSRPSGLQVDTAEQVAEKVLEQIVSEVAEANM